MDKKHKLPSADRNPKKTKVDSEEPSIITSPLLQGRTLKVIPPKVPKSGAEGEKHTASDSVVMNQEQANIDIPPEQLKTLKMEVDQKPLPKIKFSPLKPPVTVTDSTNQSVKAQDESISLKAPSSSQKSSPANTITPLVPNKGKSSPGKDEKGENVPPSTQSTSKVKVGTKSPSKSDDAIQKSLKKMEFNEDRSKIVEVIQQAKIDKRRVVITDRRLLDYSSNKYLGHIVYTGATSRAPHSNRGADLELFLIPEFNDSHHFATIQVRIPAEFLSYRGNIAVRKSALWGTDIYTDDSDVVASHYRPVDAPDPVAADIELVQEPEIEDLKSSSIKEMTEFSVKVAPVIAKADPVFSSGTTLVPDHDLHVTLRILPKLAKYTGSTRFGLDSKGWGSHDGESVRVERVEKVPNGSVKRTIRKSVAASFSNQAKFAESSPIMLFDETGQIKYKYSPEAMTEWPNFLKHLLHSSFTTKFEYSQDELRANKDQPYWKLRMRRYRCLFEDGHQNSYEIALNNETVSISRNGTPIHDKISVEAISWNNIGLVVKGILTVEAKRVSWLKI